MSREGLALRQVLAEAGCELTPDQLTAALEEAKRDLLRNHPEGQVSVLDVFGAMSRAIERRRVR